MPTRDPLDESTQALTMTSSTRPTAMLPDTDQRADAVARLQAAVERRGLRAGVEGRATLAIVIPSDAGVNLDPSERRWLVSAAQAAGFTHVAFEIFGAAGGREASADAGASEPDLPPRQTSALSSPYGKA